MLPPEGGLGAADGAVHSDVDDGACHASVDEAAADQVDALCTKISCVIAHDKRADIQALPTRRYQSPMGRRTIRQRRLQQTIQRVRESTTTGRLTERPNRERGRSHAWHPCCHQQRDGRVAG